nr:immunoglobulin heavy chain junction region [Macaca mulatta]MOV38523.1 immunoglobulin heavy chain junction region [Macaca mulatta]MOV40052.1 immunoglobulin heavy chain junction region [Macaca mulatta]MOV40413.1 immunoglobulin heavy chain junction region [Macaca mulatta]MOV42612.1 immunoglobulin heavy chain junction region [Macaca mulatta]
CVRRLDGTAFDYW